MASYVVALSSLNSSRINSPRNSKKSDNDTDPPSPVSIVEVDNTAVERHRPSVTSVKGFSKVFPSFRRNPTAVGTQWSAELASLRGAGTSFEAALCLRSVRTLLHDVDYSDRIRFCKEDFSQSIAGLKENQRIWTADLMEDVIDIYITYFNQSRFRSTPHCLLTEIFLWLPIGEFAVVSQVCREWSMLAREEYIWRCFYYYRFLRTNTVIYRAMALSVTTNVPTSALVAALTTPNALPDVAVVDTAVAAAVGSNITCYRAAFRSRLSDPSIGDKVEVAWRGKFRLDGADVYQGLAWWVAEVVDKHAALSKYKIRYPGWDSRWDEWVPKSRLRWSVEDNQVARINVNDRVEIWCCGANVPGAWLDSRVRKIRGGRYCVGKVIANGTLWVDRSRLRPATVRAIGRREQVVDDATNVTSAPESALIDVNQAHEPDAVINNPASRRSTWSVVRRFLRSGGSTEAANNSRQRGTNNQDHAATPRARSWFHQAPRARSSGQESRFRYTEPVEDVTIGRRTATPSTHGHLRGDEEDYSAGVQESRGLRNEVAEDEGDVDNDEEEDEDTSIRLDAGAGDGAREDDREVLRHLQRIRYNPEDAQAPGTFGQSLEDTMPLGDYELEFERRLQLHDRRPRLQSSKCLIM